MWLNVDVGAYFVKSDDNKNKGEAEFVAAMDALNRKLASEEWLVSDEFRDRLTKLGEQMSDLLKKLLPDEHAFFVANSSVISTAEIELKRIARRDIGVAQPATIFARLLARLVADTRSARPR
jgi:hypothetical protein